MNHLVLLAFVLVGLHGLAAAEPEKRLTIATFNCEFLTRPKVHVKFGLPFDINDAPAGDRDQWAQAGLRDQKFREAVEAVAGVLRQLEADVLALTGVGNSADTTQLRDELAAQGTNYPHMAVCDSADTTTKQFVAILSKFPLSGVLNTIAGRESYVTEDDDPDAEAVTGISKGLRATVTAYGKEFIVYVLQLASVRAGNEQGSQQRIAQASIVRRHCLPFLADSRLVIVAGDLNARRGQPTLRRIRGLDDVHEDLIQTGHVEYFASDKLDTRWTYESDGVRQQIDHILLSQAIQSACKAPNGVQARTFEHNVALASDHRPLVVTLRLKD